MLDNRLSFKNMKKMKANEVSEIKKEKASSDSDIDLEPLELRKNRVKSTVILNFFTFIKLQHFRWPLNSTINTNT